MSLATIKGPPVGHEYGTTSRVRATTRGNDCTLLLGRSTRPPRLLPTTVGIALDNELVGRALETVDRALGEQRVG